MSASHSAPRTVSSPDSGLDQYPVVHPATYGRSFYSMQVAANLLLRDAAQTKRSESTDSAYIAAGTTKPDAAKVDKLLRQGMVKHFERMAASTQENAAIALRSDRLTLATLEPHQVEIFEEYCQHSLPEEFIGRKEAAGPDQQWSEWLSDDINTDELEEFIKWHVRHLQDQQTSPETEKKIAYTKDEYAQNVLAAVAAGNLHPDAEAAAQRVQDIDVSIGDVFDTLMQVNGGYHVTGSKAIVVAAPLRARNYLGLGYYIAKVAPHEFNHAVLGTFGRRWLNEALTEHIASAFDGGPWQKIDPAAHPTHKETYREERELLHGLLTLGKEAISPTLLTKAYSAGARNFSRETEAVHEALDKAWGHLLVSHDNVLDMVNMRVSKYERALLMPHEGRVTKLQEREAQKQALARVYEELKTTPDVIVNATKNAGVKV